ncbi:hypothetical protein MTO96_042867, partial [Rhipicephalus appendiculatus]
MSSTKANAASPTTGSPSATGSSNAVPGEKKHKKRSKSPKGSSVDKGND